MISEHIVPCLVPDSPKPTKHVLACCGAKLYKGETCICTDGVAPSSDKARIIRLFLKNVKGKKFDKCASDACGKEGHWLETLMGIKHNADNAPDIYGYDPLGKNKEDKDLYWRTFERTNSKPMTIGGWKLDKWDPDGQILKIDEQNNINIVYNYTIDKREDKMERVSGYYKDNKDHIIGTWKSSTLRKVIENKFNVNGFYICKKNKKKEYEKICFGKPFTFEYWIEQFKLYNIYYDGYSGVSRRWRGCFRASMGWWNKHITEEH